MENFDRQEGKTCPPLLMQKASITVNDFVFEAHKSAMGTGYKPHLVGYLVC